MGSILEKLFVVSIRSCQKLASRETVQIISAYQRTVALTIRGKVDMIIKTGSKTIIVTSDI